jgi:Lrp/AsnC family transcriptional regulator for asnA, asnC and gidA
MSEKKQNNENPPDGKRPVKKRKLDRIDCEMIRLLQQDGRIPNTEIAKTIGISEATVRSRLNRLTGEGYIQIVAVSNPLKIGFEIAGVMRICAELSKIEQVVAELEKLAEVWFIVNSTGEADIHTEFICRSMEDLNELIYRKINTIDGVTRTETSLILNYSKRRYDWGTGLD